MADLDRLKIQVPSFGRPHVVILGAGASLAAMLNGDKYGRKLPLMWNIVDVVGLGPLLDMAGIGQHRDNFEKLYSDLVLAGDQSDLVVAIDQAIFDYFADLKLPDGPTLYDHLVRSLRKKDVIATFNWDPFLIQAVARNGGGQDSPRLLFLHGNTDVGYCMDHAPVHSGRRGRNCSHCGQPFRESRLLYPVGQKSYSSDPFIAKSWELLQGFLQDAYLLTIFGYSAPVTDVEAVGLLRASWGEPGQRSLEEIEIIDVKDDEELYRTWRPFIHSHHYQTTKSFSQSIIGQNPRRSCEAMWACMMDCAPGEPNPIPDGASWEETWRFYDVLLEDERANVLGD